MGASFPVLRRFRAVCIFGKLSCAPHKVDFFGHVAKSSNDGIARFMLLKAKNRLDRPAEFSLQGRECAEVCADRLMGFGNPVHWRASGQTALSSAREPPGAFFRAGGSLAAGAQSG